MAGVVARWIAEHRSARIASIASAVLCIVLLGSLLLPARSLQLRISSGAGQTRRHAIAQYLVRQAATHRLSLELVDTAGSEDCLQQIKAGRLDAGIVCSGMVIPNDDDIMVLGAMQKELAHVHVRKELVGAGPLADVLRGKRMNVGKRGSTEWLLSHEFLKFAKLQVPTATDAGDVVLTELGGDELLARARGILETTNAVAKAQLIAEMPDCIVSLAPLPSKVTLALVEAVDYQLVSLPATKAFLLDNLQESSASHTIIDREFLEPTVIPAHSYYVRQVLPATDCETVGVRMLLVAHRNTPAAAIRPLMKTLFEGEFALRIATKSPRELPTPYAIHPAAAAYLDRDKPLIVRDLAESLSTLLSVFGAFSAGALSLYGLLWRKKRRKPVDYYAKIQQLEQLVIGPPADGTTLMPPQELARYLDDRLLQLRHELITDVCDGRLEGDQVVANILGLLTDSRQHLPLHARKLPPERVIPVRRAG